MRMIPDKNIALIISRPIMKIISENNIRIYVFIDKIEYYLYYNTFSFTHVKNFTILELNKNLSYNDNKEYFLETGNTRECIHQESYNDNKLSIQQFRNDMNFSTKENEENFVKRVTYKKAFPENPMLHV